MLLGLSGGDRPGFRRSGLDDMIVDGSYSSREFTMACTVYVLRLSLFDERQ